LFDHRSQIDEAPRHRNVRRIERPNLVAALDLPAAQQVRPDLVGRVFATRVRLAIQRFDTHALHQRAYVLAPNHKILAPQQAYQHACAGKRMLQMQFVDAAHNARSASLTGRGWY